MEKLTEVTTKIMIERFGKDNIISLATADNNIPYVRSVNAYYENGAFYVITYRLSNKMKQIEKNPAVAVSGDWFTGAGIAKSLGGFGKSENAELTVKLRNAFGEWIDNGHNDFQDENTIILQVELTEGVLFSNGKRYHIDFTK